MSDLYVDPNKITAIRPANKNNNNYTATNTFMSNGTNIQPIINYDEPGNTIIITENTSFFIEEHIVEVIALLEGRDPRPAKILYGKE